MKFFLLCFLFSGCTTLFAQVPHTPVREATDVVPDSYGKMQENIGYYHQDGKYGFIIKGERQEPIYDRIISSLGGYVVIQNKQYGIVDKNGKNVTAIKYDSIGGFRAEKKFVVKLKNRVGLFSDSGEQILPIQYNRILSGNATVSLVEDRKGKMQLISHKTKKPAIKNISFVDMYSNLAIIKSNGKFGVFTSKIIIPFEYDSIFFETGKTGFSATQNKTYQIIHASRSIPDLILQKEGKLGLADSEGHIIYETDYDQVVRESMKGYYSIRKGNLYSIYFVHAKLKTDLVFDRMYTDGTGYVMAIKNKKAGVFNMKGQEIVPFEYDDEFIAQYSGLGLRVTKNKKRGIVDPNGKIIVPVIYDDVQTFYESGFGNFIKVELDNKVGVISLQGEQIIPVEYDWVGEENGFFKVVTPDPERKFGLFSKEGRVIVPTEYQWITDTDTEHSKVTVLKKKEQEYYFLNRNAVFILNEPITEFGYVLDEQLLLNPFSSNSNKILRIKSKNNKYGLINETTETLVVPLIYDDIIQRFEKEERSYFSVRLGNKYGLINEKNERIIPIQYDEIDLDGVAWDYNREAAVVLRLNNKYAVVNLKNEIIIPFQYDELKRISDNGMYKAKQGKKYTIVDVHGKPITTETFDEVANFERMEDKWGESIGYQTLTFLNGNMRVMNEKGEFLSSIQKMQPHVGYKTFDELKFALVDAMNDSSNLPLREFVEKISPSAHILYYLKKNVFDNRELYVGSTEYIQEKYLRELLEFKYNEWHADTSFGYRGYDRRALTHVTDYGIYKAGVVTNTRSEEWDFGSIRCLERFLRNAIKINGYWISSYFMKRNF